MRITKKYAGAACLGRRAYHYREHAPPTIGEIQLAKTQLDDLEHRFRMRVEEGYTGLPYSSTTAQNSTVPPQTHSSVTLTIDQMNSVLGLQNALHSLASNTRQHADIHNQIPTPASWNQSHAATMFQNQPIPSMYVKIEFQCDPLTFLHGSYFLFLGLFRPQQHPNAVEVAKLLLAQNQATPNLIPVLAQLLSTAGTPVIPSAAPYQVNNANSSAALLPILASILGSASVTPQAQAASNAIHLAPAPVVSQTSQNPAASMSLPQVSNAPTYANIPSHISQVVPPTYLEVNSQGNDQTSSNPFVDQLKNVYELHMSSLGQTSAPLSTHGIQNHQERRTQQPLAIASKPPREPFSSVSAQKQTPFSIPDRSSRQEDSNGGENQTDGSILVGFLSSLKESYLKALQTPDGEKVENGPRNTVGVGEPARVPTVTDTSSVSQHGSSTEEVDWNPDRRVNGHAGGEKRTIGISSKGPPRKRHKQKQQTRRD